MNSLSVGDLARHMQLRADQSRIQSDLLRLSQELSTGRKSDIGTAVAGDFGPLVGLDADLRRLDGYDTTVSEATLLTAAAQSSFDLVQARSQDLAANLLLVQDTTNPRTVDQVGAEARQTFDSVVSALNQSVGDKTIFGGTATNAPALADPDTILAALTTAVAAETSAADVAAVLDTWFAPGGDFDTVAYLGSTNQRADIRLNDDSSVAFTASAADTELREVLKSVALGALLDEGVLGADTGERAELARLSGERLISAETGLIDMRSGIGRAEEAIANAQTRNEAQRSALDITRNELLAADPFETAAELEAVQFQLETLYTVTARLSRLSLANYL